MMASGRQSPTFTQTVTCRPTWISTADISTGEYLFTGGDMVWVDFNQPVEEPEVEEPCEELPVVFGHPEDDCLKLIRRERPWKPPKVA